jgi:hypothetical protein
MLICKHVPLFFVLNGSSQHTVETDLVHVGTGSEDVSTAASCVDVWRTVILQESLKERRTLILVVLI